MKLLAQILNFLFQSLWFLLHGLIPRKIGRGDRLIHYSPRIVAQLLLSYLFGGPRIALLGDSNSAVFSRWTVMIRFDVVAVSIGVPGTRMDQWADFFETKTGRFVLWLLRPAIDFVNLGGNNALHRKAEIIESASSRVKSFLPESWIILIPPIHVDYFSILVPPDSLQKDINRINKALRKEWAPRVIDPSPLVDRDSDGIPDEGALGDPVHYAIRVVKEMQAGIEYLALDR
ncbi:MAG: SGNH/GDSL hydrolase family protein [Leptospiraceae bacterium]|nr:SGNH/GDSL hydrolase family protein [Leptospiraceae bacterium]